MSSHYVAVAPNKYPVGVDGKRDDWRIAPGEAGNAREGGARAVFHMMPLLEALGRTYETDAHLATYVVSNGEPLGRQPRCNKGGLEWLTEQGYDLTADVLFADVDNPGHSRWTPELKAAAAEQWRSLPVLRSCGVYHTSHGLRYVQTLAEPVPIPDVERYLGAWLAELQAAGIPADPSCKDWTRLFRLPNVVRDEKRYRTPHMDLSRMRPREITLIAQERAEPSAPQRARSEGDGESDTIPKGTSPPPREDWPPLHERAKRASRYVARMPEAIQGDNGSRAAFNVALELTKGFGLQADAAREIFSRDYNHRCDPPWSDEEINHKIKSAAESNADAGYRLADNEPRPDPDASTPEAAQAATGPGSREGTEAELPEGVDPCTDLANGYRLVHLHGHDLHFARSLGWLVFDDQRWPVDATGAAQRRAYDVGPAVAREATELFEAAMLADKDEAKLLAAEAARRASWARASEQENRIRAALTITSAFESIAVAGDAFDQHADLLNVSNGTLGLRTGELREHRREDLITKLSTVNYDPAAQSPLFDAFLARIFDGHKELINFVQRAVGYSLTGSTAEQCFFLLWGSGANGKSTLLEAVRRVLGDYAANTSTDVLMATGRGRGPENDVARLRGARFVSAAESGEGRRLDEERIKRLTGGDTITARFLYREHFEFVPEFKLWLAVNAKPEIRGTDHAMWRRVRLIPFAVTIPEDEQDRELLAKLWAEAPGILRWAVEGCRAWREQGLDPPADVTDATAEYRVEQDVVARFVAECCVMLPEASAMAGALYAAFKDWCLKQGEEPMSQTAFGRRLGADERFKRERTKRGILWRGLGLEADQDDDRKAGS